MIFAPLLRLVFPTHVPLFGYDERAVYVALCEVCMSTLFKVFCQGFEYAAKNPILDPSLEATVAGLVGRVALGKVFPRRSSTQYPQDGVENISGISPGSASAVFSLRGIWDEWLQHFPSITQAPASPRASAATEL
jgi:hypothetical protein